MSAQFLEGLQQLRLVPQKPSPSVGTGLVPVRPDPANTGAIGVPRTGAVGTGLAPVRVPTGYQEPADSELASSLYTHFLQYRQELLDWNTRTNLTAITNPDDVLIKHFLDSLSLLQAYDSPVEVAPCANPPCAAPPRLLDIGSGAGFPGLPLKIARPDWHVTLLEATGKKVAFLQHMLKVLGLKEIEVMHGRAEELAHKNHYRAAFDIVTARAVSALPTLLEYCAPYCRIGGYILLPKKGDLTGELEQGKRAAKLVGATFHADITVTLPSLDDGRRILVWQQQRACPITYPRRGTAMAKKPLG